MIKHFWGSYLTLIVVSVTAFFLWGLSGLYIVLLLTLLEVSLSFDNAVVNAKILGTMDPIWQKRFIIWGIPIAVFGMRCVIPVIIVWAISDMSLMQTFIFAVGDTERYSAVLRENEDLIYAFGGAFLIMVAQSFYFDKSRKIFWIEFWENNFIVQRVSQIKSIAIICATAGGIALLAVTDSASIGIAYFMGVLLFEIIHKTSALFPSGGARSGLASFIYLELLDASFSLDGVIGAFALSDNIFIIMMGLGVGALFVRSITLFLVHKGSIVEYRYLEHGAYYAIFVLALIMFMKIFWEVEEWITGSISAVFIVSAFIHSIIINKRQFD
jgi:hypothetical protein